MASKKITLFMVPDGAGRVKQLRVSGLLLVWLVMLFSLSVIGFFLTLHAYSKISHKIPRLAELQKENALQKEQLLHMARKIDRFTQEMAELRKADHTLKEMVNLEAVEGDEQFRGVGGSDPSLLDPKITVTKVNRDLVRAMHRSLDNLDSDIESSKEDKTGLLKFLENQKILLASKPSIWPVKGWLSSSFGYRSSPFTGVKEFHKGIDVSTRAGSPIVASADGVVSFTGWDRGYGRVVLIKHGHGFETRYAHLNKSIVKKGQRVKRGETIGLVGTSGKTTGPHLHYEVHLNGVAVNPIRYVLR
ncbi:MAG: M23 family metallopeptidase [Deltaproteobacteria bacterium]|nr:M23 family metallopeptidase [Deltaproteobacteria bacterium]